MADLGLLEQLRREPDVEAPDLVAVDATDRLLLDEAAELLAATGPGEVAVVDDSYGALTLGAVAAGARDVRVHQDLLVGELALARNAERTGLTGSHRSLPLGPGLADGVRLVLAKAPKSLDALRELTEVVAASAAPDVTLLVGGRVKHMTHAMNDVLGAVQGDRAQGQRPVAVVDDGDLARPGQREGGGRLVEQQPVGRVDGDQLRRLHVRSPTEEGEQIGAGHGHHSPPWP